MPDHPIVLGIDQGNCSGWAMVQGTKVIGLGIATTVAKRHAVVLGAWQQAQRVGVPCVAVLEDHSKVTLRKGTRSSGGPVKRETATILGMGDSRGRWREQCELLGVRHCMVATEEWRPAVLGISAKTRTESAKACALEFTRRLLMQPGNATCPAAERHDAAEALCIAWYGVRSREVERLAKMRKRKSVAGGAA